MGSGSEPVVDSRYRVGGSKVAGVRTLGACLVVATVFALLPPSAGAGAAVGGVAARESAPYLTSGEAARVIGRYLRREYSGGVTRGSLDAECSRTSRTGVRCAFNFRDASGEFACGSISVKERRGSYGVRVRSLGPCMSG